MKNRIKHIIEDSIAAKTAMLMNPMMIETIEKVVDLCVLAYRGKQKILFCGNGGSAADAQHLAAELSGRFYINRPPLFAEALHVNGSYLTAVSNDFSFEDIYSRAIEAKCVPGDILIAISTSGNSPNILKAVAQAKKMGVITIGFTGQTGGKMMKLCDYIIAVPSIDTPRIQESHILIGHIICELVESALFKN